jgi:hypothetical protein
VLITCADGRLWGRAGGELKYVSQRVEYRYVPDSLQKYQPVMVVRFTDHDHAASPSDDLIEGGFYELEFLISQE